MDFTLTILKDSVDVTITENELIFLVISVLATIHNVIAYPLTVGIGARYN